MYISYIMSKASEKLFETSPHFVVCLIQNLSFFIDKCSIVLLGLQNFHLRILKKVITFGRISRV